MDIQNLPSHNRHYTRISLSGDPIEVLAEVKKRISEDKVVSMYEHMKLRIEDMNLNEFPQSLTVILGKNHYAGD